MPTPWTDLARPPLSSTRLSGTLCRGGLWREIRVVERTASTNADVRAAADRGEAEGLVVLAEQQTAGRGRLDRSWESPPRAGVLLSFLLRPQVPAAALPLLSLLAGVAVVEAVRSVAKLPARLKWPNDVLVEGGKLGGLLVERTGSAAVVGLGLNVSTRRDELAVESATSVALAGGQADRESLVKELLRAFERRYSAFTEQRGSSQAVLPAYREVCDTIGRVVTVQVSGGPVARGTAVAVDDHGMLVVRDSDGVEHTWSAGDVVHVRPGD